MRPIVIHNLPIGLLYVAALVLPGVIESRLRARPAKRSRSATEWSLIVGVLGLLSCLAIATVAALENWAPLPGGVWWPAIVGIAIMWIGSAVRLWAVVTLGRFFKLAVVIQGDHRVIENGPYRRLRHPAYLGSLIFFTGIGFVCSDWISLIVLSVGATCLLSLRIVVEERALVQALGNDYALYMQRTARLVPGVY